MNKKNVILVALVLALAAAYVVYFTDWLQRATIHISHTSRPMAGVRGPAGVHLTFSLGDDYELTEVRVVPLDALKTNPLTQPVWHLIGDPTSDSVSTFAYGEKIDGMNPAVAGSRAEPLQPGVVYRLFVQAGSAKGQHDFQIGAAPVK